VLSTLPSRLSEVTQAMLTELGVKVHTSVRVDEVLRDGLRLAGGQVLPAELVVWAAGVKAPEFLKALGFETNGIYQLVVRPTLRRRDRQRPVRPRARVGGPGLCGHAV